MKVLFVGSKDMGVRALELFHDGGAEILAVIARADDDPAASGWYRSVAGRAAHFGLAVYRPEDINSAESIALFRELRPDLVFTAFYPRIYSREVLSCIDAVFLNVHFAPLPRYRGCMPGAWAIINGESSHGVTVHHMAPGVDNGDIAFQMNVPIAANETGISLYRKCNRVGAELLRLALPDILAGRIPATPQNHRRALYRRRGYPYGGVVSWGWDAAFVERYVRAMTFPPFRNPFTFVGDTKVFVDAVTLIDADVVGTMPGTILRNDPVQVQCGRGVVQIDDVSFASERARASTRFPVAARLGQ